MGDALFLRVQRLAEVRGLGRRALVDLAEILFGQGEAFFGRHVAGQRQHRIVRAVVVAMEGAHIVEAGVLQIDEAAVAVVVVLPLLEGLLRDVDPHEAAIGLVLHVDADFFLDHVLLVLQRLGVEVERLHAIGFQPQDRFQCRHRGNLDVVGVIRPGGTIVAAAAAGDHLVERALRRIRRALEHQVLEEVREAGAILRLQAHADLVDDADTHHRCAAIFRNNHRQAIVQRLHRHRDFPAIRVGISSEQGHGQRQTNQQRQQGTSGFDDHGRWPA